MPVVLGKERSKYGSGVGTIICWPVELTSSDPNNDDNIRKLPAGYLKCDGTVYKAEDYPQLAEILGVKKVNLSLLIFFKGYSLFKTIPDNNLLS